MNSIDVKQINNDLTKLNTDISTKELILNLVSLYNDLVIRYKDNTINKEIYLLFQVNGQIIRLINDIKKKNKDLGIGRPESKLTLIKRKLNKK